MKKFDKKTQIKILNIILIIIWMITIFRFSGQIGTESGNTSRKFTVQIIKIITGKNLSTWKTFSFKRLKNAVFLSTFQHFQHSLC